MNPRPFVSVIVVNWNSRDDLVDCLASIDASGRDDLEVIVVDNGSTDGSLEMLRERFPWVVAIDTGENLGFAEGCNRGIALATAPWIFLFNNDAVLADGALDRLRRAAREAPADVGMIQPRIVFKHAPDYLNSSGVLIFPDGTARDRDFAEPVAAVHPRAEVFCVTAGAGLYRHDMLRAVRLSSGILDRRFFMYFEDLDLGWRCRRAGYGALFVEDAVVLHAFHGSASRRGNTFVATQCRVNRVNVLVKNASRSMIVRSLPRTVGDIAWLVRHGKAGTLLQLARTVVGSWSARRRVDELAAVAPERLERDWVTAYYPAPQPPAKPHEARS